MECALDQDNVIDHDKTHDEAMTGDDDGPPMDRKTHWTLIGYRDTIPICLWCRSTCVTRALSDSNRASHFSSKQHLHCGTPSSDDSIG